jgi:FAD-linked sulfhydryl oxidase
MFALEAASCKGPGFAACPRVAASSPEVFGPPLWFSLHTIAARYPERPDAATANACVQVFEALPRLLPCEDCGRHFGAFLQASDLRQACGGREALAQLLCHAHNDVNARLGKEAQTCEDMVERYGSSPHCRSTEAPDADALLLTLKDMVTAGLQHRGAQSVCTASCAQ